MKKLLFGLLIIIAACTSCNKCVDCTSTMKTTYNNGTPPSTATSRGNVCGTAKEISEAEGTTTATATSGNIIVTQTTTTNCN